MVWLWDWRDVRIISRHNLSQAIMEYTRWARHSLVNLVQTVLLIAFMTAFLGLLGWIIWGPSGVVALLAAAVVIMLLNPVASPWLVLQVYQARPLSPRELPAVSDALRQLAQRAGLPAVPALFYVPSRMANAFAVGNQHESAIVLTDGLLRALGMRELIGVLGHEVSHISHNDLRVMGLADLLSRLTGMLSFFGQLLLLINLPLLLLTDATVSWPAIALLIFAPHLSMLAQLGLSRTREYQADFNAARLTGDPGGLASALIKIDRSQHSLLGRLLFPGWGHREPSWLRSHPPTAERVRRLAQLEGRGELSKPEGGTAHEWKYPQPQRRPRYHIGGHWY